MQIVVVTPAGPDSKAGNRATALRWKALLETAGHQVNVLTAYQGETCDLMIALHAWRSAEAVRQFREDWPDKPLIVVLTGTDIYRFQYECPEPTRASMAAADVLIGLHDQVAQDIPEAFRSKLITLRQSAEKPTVAGSSKAEPGRFDVCVIGHLREEKDSLRAAWATHYLPEESEIVVSCAGKAHNEAWHNKALEESRANPRFHYLEQLDKPALENLMAVSRLMVISSVMEGGANVVSEACRAGLPILASDIPGNRGLLGDDYPGYFPPKDEKALAQLMRRAETDPGFLAELNERVCRLADTFTPEQERQSLEQALEKAVAGKMLV
ncbi:MAG: group 1 glycosyl transferase [Marinobacter sp. T13-3]|nr:MAG: group 1 glycosyl transferase [Marinobacter sp. T13-3]